MLWGTYHFGKGDSPGAQQAAFFLDSSRPDPRTLLALDLEANEGDLPSGVVRACLRVIAAQHGGTEEKRRRNRQ